MGILRLAPTAGPRGARFLELSARLFVLGAPLCSRFLEYFLVVVFRRQCARHFFPLALKSSRLQQDFEVPNACSVLARFFVLRAPLSPRLLEDREVPAACSACACAFVLRAPLGLRPLEHRRVPL